MMWPFNKPKLNFAQKQALREAHTEAEWTRKPAVRKKVKDDSGEYASSFPKLGETDLVHSTGKRLTGIKPEKFWK